MKVKIYFFNFVISCHKISCHIISCHNISSIFSYRSSCFANFGLQSYYPPSPPELSQSLSLQTLSLCSDKGIHLFIPQSHIFHCPWCHSISHITIFPFAIVEDPHCLTYRGPYSVDIGSFILEELGCFMLLIHTLDGPLMQQIVPVIPRCV